MSKDFQASPSVPQLVWVGDGAWVAQDRTLSGNDPRQVIAYVEHKDHRVYVLWVRDRQDVGCYDTLLAAVEEMAAVCSADPAGRGIQR